MYRYGVRFGLIVVLILSALLAACQAPQPETPTPTTGELGFSELVGALRNAGAAAALAGTVEQPFFPVVAQLVDVNGASVQVFEFETAEQRESAAETIRGEGYEIGSSMVSWIEPPHFWSEGRVIVLYVGSDQAVIDTLSTVLGEPIAG